MTPLAILTLVHVVISLVGLAAGFIVLWGMFNSRRFDGWTLVFLVTTVATSATGFLFPVERLLPSHILGIISLVVLAVAIAARYRFGMQGLWRPVFVVTALLAQYLNFFVLIVQSFLKVPALHALAPNQTEPPFAIAQLVALVVFIALIVVAVKRFRLPGVA